MGKTRFTCDSMEQRSEAISKISQLPAMQKLFYKPCYKLLCLGGCDNLFFILHKSSHHPLPQGLCFILDIKVQKGLEQIQVVKRSLTKWFWNRHIEITRLEINDVMPSAIKDVVKLCLIYTTNQDAIAATFLEGILTAWVKTLTVYIFDPAICHFTVIKILHLTIWKELFEKYMIRYCQ